jgi:DeoR/GlpR family transcriptional regulator of sugar metabolism
MIFSRRQVNIINKLVAASEPPEIKEIARAEGVSVQTIYNDLRLIKNITFSVHRGRIGVTLEEDRNSVVKEKILSHKAIREQACDYVIENILNGNPRGVMFIDGGSTGFLFFEALRKRGVRDLIIMSNNPLVIGSISEDESFFYQNSVFVAGGKLDPVRISLYSIASGGDFVAVRGEANSIDVCILGVRAISRKGDLYIDNEEEVSQKKNLISKSGNLILVVTPDKLCASGLFKIASLSKELKSKKKRVNLVVADDGTLNSDASATLKGLADLLGKSSIKILNEC